MYKNEEKFNLLSEIESNRDFIVSSDRWTKILDLCSKFIDGVGLSIDNHLTLLRSRLDEINSIMIESFLYNVERSLHKIEPRSRIVDRYWLDNLSYPILNSVKYDIKLEVNDLIKFRTQYKTIKVVKRKSKIIDVKYSRILPHSFEIKYFRDNKNIIKLLIKSKSIKLLENYTKHMSTDSHFMKELESILSKLNISAKADKTLIGTFSCSSFSNLFMLVWL